MLAGLLPFPALDPCPPEATGAPGSDSKVKEEKKLRAQKNATTAVMQAAAKKATTRIRVTRSICRERDRERAERVYVRDIL